MKVRCSLADFKVRVDLHYNYFLIASRAAFGEHDLGNYRHAELPLNQFYFVSFFANRDEFLAGDASTMMRGKVLIFALH